MSGPGDDDLRRAARAWLRDAEAFGVDEVPVARSAPAGPAPPPAKESSPADADLSEVDSLAQIAGEVEACVRCGLSGTRNRVVPGQGHPSARILFVGEAPGADEDRQGLAFVGRAGQLLTRMIAAMGFGREDVFIANVLKCRPPGNRDPRPDEVASCLPFLHRQVALIHPEVIVALGSHAMRGLTGSDVSIGRMRGRVHDYRGTPLVATYHPAFLLRSPHMKKAAWEDLQLALSVLGLEAPARGGGA